MRANAIAFMPATPRGGVSNHASRPCDEAKVNQIVVSRHVFGMVEPWVEGNSLEKLSLKEFNHPVLAAEILRWRDEADDVERRWPKRRGEGSSLRDWRGV